MHITDTNVVSRNPPTKLLKLALLSIIIGTSLERIILYGFVKCATLMGRARNGKCKRISRV